MDDWGKMAAELRRSLERNRSDEKRAIGNAYLLAGRWWWGGEALPQGPGLRSLGNGTVIDGSDGSVYREDEVGDHPGR